VFTQAWRNAAFVHWPVDPALVAPLLPAGVRPDTLHGVTQVGLIAFHMERIGIGRTPGLPYLGTFAETNVRLYTVDGVGRRGVFFLSLDATRLLPVLVGRALGVPYSWARMRIGAGYETRRRWPGPAAESRLAVRTGEPIAEPSELERFVTARWGLHLALRTGTGYWPNEHPEWPLHRAEMTDLDDGLVAATGLPAPTGTPSSVLWSPGVRVRFGPRRPVERR
jgi:uncharacterized protein YqjF (DUF2071 family)